VTSCAGLNAVNNWRGTESHETSRRLDNDSSYLGLFLGKVPCRVLRLTDAQVTDETIRFGLKTIGQVSGQAD